MNRFRFSWKITLIGLFLIVGMVRLSYWQWERYLQKEELLAELERRVNLPVVELDELLTTNPSPEDNRHRRVYVHGEWDFKHEIVKRNRKDDEDGPGVHVITPLKLRGKDHFILVNRGYIPLSVQSPEKRKAFQQSTPTSFVGLIKLGELPRWGLAPSDPSIQEGDDWVDAWLRVNIGEIEKQLPYELLPFQVEMMSSTRPEDIEEALIKNSKSRNEIFQLTDTSVKVSTGEINPDKNYPVPAFSTVVPSATHLLYVFEWAAMALGTFIICIILQLRRNERS